MASMTKQIVECMVFGAAANIIDNSLQVELATQVTSQLEDSCEMLNCMKLGQGRVKSEGWCLEELLTRCLMNRQ